MLRLRASRPASIAVRRPASQCYQPTCYSCRTASISVFIASSLSSRIQGDFAQRAKRQLFRRTIPSSSPHSTLHLNVPYILAESDSVLRAKKTTISPHIPKSPSHFASTAESDLATPHAIRRIFRQPLPPPKPQHPPKCFGSYIFEQNVILP